MYPTFLISIGVRLYSLVIVFIEISIEYYIFAYGHGNFDLSKSGNNKGENK